jgi:hypothetical protein
MNKHDTCTMTHKTPLSFVDDYITHVPALTRMYWLLGQSTASTSNIEILECFQSIVLHMIVDAPCYVPNMVIRRDLQTPAVKEEIHHYSSQYSVHLSVHPNNLVVNLMAQPNNRQS